MNQSDTVEQRTTRKWVILSIRGIINHSSTTSLQKRLIIMNQPRSTLNYSSFIKANYTNYCTNYKIGQCKTVVYHSPYNRAKIVETVKTLFFPFKFLIAEFCLVPLHRHNSHRQDTQQMGGREGVDSLKYSVHVSLFSTESVGSDTCTHMT